MNRLTLIGKTNLSTKDRHKLYKYICSCGNTVLLAKRKVTGGNTKSCGCLKAESSARNVSKVQHLAAAAAKVSNRKHGMRNTRFYSIWQGMKSRCSDLNNPYYGARGIVICERWNNFQNFYDDMYESYTKHTIKYGEERKNSSIDRIDPNGNYELSNCKWATMLEQRHNQRKKL